MRERHWFILLFAIMYTAGIQPAYAGSDRAEQKRLVGSLYQKFPELQTMRPLCVVVTSVQNCVGCGTLAVNSTIELLQQIDSTATCAVVLVAEKQSQAAAIQSKFLAPFILVDTSAALLSPTYTASFPQLWVLAAGDSVLFRQDDLQHTPLDYVTVQKVLSSAGSPRSIEENDRMSGSRQEEERATASQQATADTAGSRKEMCILEEPPAYSIGRLSSPVLMPGTHTLYAINTLNNTIGAWSATTGKFEYSIALPDTVVFYFRRDSSDLRWLDMKKQGHDIASLRALAADNDTLFVLLDILSGYTKEKKIGRTPVGTIDTIVEVKWSKRQLVLSIYDRHILSVFEVPTKYFMIELCTVGKGSFGGTCVWSKFRIDSSAAGQADSTQFLQIYGDRAVVADYTPAIEKMRSTLLAGQDSILSIGAVAAYTDGTIWYCDPRHQALLALQTKGRVRSIRADGILRSSKGGIVLAGKKRTPEPGQDSIYSIRGMVAGEKKVLLLLAPDYPTTDLPPVFQTYSTNSALTGEQYIANPLVNSVEFVRLIAVEQGSAVLLAKVKSSWSVLRIPLESE